MHCTVVYVHTYVCKYIHVRYKATIVYLSLFEIKISGGIIVGGIIIGNLHHGHLPPIEPRNNQQDDTTPLGLEHQRCNRLQ